MKKSLYVISFLVLFSCDPVDLRLEFINTSDKDVYVDLVRNDTINELIWVSNLEAFYQEYNKDIKDDLIEPGETKVLSTIGNWEGILKDTTKLIRVFILEYDYFLNKDSINIFESIHIYKYNLNDLKRNNWKVEFNCVE